MSVVPLAACPMMPASEVQQILQQAGLIGAHVQYHRNDAHRMDPGGGGVDG